VKAAEARARSANALSEPVFASAPDLRSEGGQLVAWYTDPPGAVVQLPAATVFTKEMAEWMVGPGLSALHQRFPQRGKLQLLLDIRPMVSREPAARTVIMSAATRHLFLFSKLGVIAPAKPPPLYMTTLYGAIALLSAIGPEIRIFETLEGALQTMGLREAPLLP
jgi:hypothetical protein